MLANLGSVPVSVEIKMASPPFSEKKNSLGKSENEDYAMKKPTTVLALFAVGNVYVSLCKRGAYAPFSARRRS